MVAFKDNALERLVMDVFSVAFAVCSAVMDATIPEDTDAIEAMRVDISLDNVVIRPEFTPVNERIEVDMVVASPPIALCRFTISFESARLRVEFTATRLEFEFEMTVLKDTMEFERLLVSVDIAELNTASTPTNEADALLNALDNDATATPRLLVSANREVLMAVSTATRDAMAELLTEAIALMRVEFSALTADDSVDTRLTVLGDTVTLLLV
jgi:hypothetical protein